MHILLIGNFEIGFNFPIILPQNLYSVHFANIGRFKWLAMSFLLISRGFLRAYIFNAA